MAETTQIHPDKVRAYLATDYRLGHTEQDINLTIGVLSESPGWIFNFQRRRMRRMVDLGAHVIFCWGERADELVPDRGSWTEIGRDFVWLSESMPRTYSAALQK